jgi:beta-galactosidase GanA
MDLYLTFSVVILLLLFGVFVDRVKAQEHIDVLLGSVINGMWPITSESVVVGKVQVAKYAGVDAFESYIPWAVLEPNQEGEFSWREIDITEKIMREQDFKWQPFFMFNPSYATPQWFKDSPESVVFECIEHRRKSDVQSIWNPDLKKHIERVLTAFAERYGESSTIHSIMLGVSGDFGETLYPAGACGWNGSYHNHLGYWANDVYAQESLQHYLKDKYGDIKNLNQQQKQPTPDLHKESQPYHPHTWLQPH